MTKKHVDYEQLKNQLESVWDKTLSTLDKGRKEVIRLSKMGKIKLDAQMMTRDKNYLFQKLGEDAYKRLREGTLTDPSLEKWAAKIDTVNKNIGDCDSKIDELSKAASKKKKASRKK